MKTALTNGLVMELNEAKSRLAELQDTSKKVAKRSKRVAKAQLRVERVLSAMKAIVVANAKAKADAKADAKRQARLARKGRLQLKKVSSQRKARALLRMLTEMGQIEVPTFLEEIKVKVGFKTAVGPRPAVRPFSAKKDGNRMNIQFFAASKKPNRKAKKYANKDKKTRIRRDFEKAVFADLKGNKHSGPKDPSFNLSAREYTLGYYRNGVQTLIEGENPKEVGRKLHQMFELRGDNHFLRDDVTPFIYVRGYEEQQYTNATGQIQKRYVSLTDIETSTLQIGSLVQRNSESHQVRDVCEKKKFGIFGYEAGNAESIVKNEVEAYDNTAQLNFKIVPVVKELTNLLTKKYKKSLNISILELANIVQKFVLNGVIMHNGREFVLYTLNSSSPAQTRKGEAAFYEYARAQRPGLFEALTDDMLRVTAVYKRFHESFDLAVYGGSKDGIWKFKLDKDPKRLDMAASGSRRSNMYSALFGEMEIIKEVMYKNGVGGTDKFIVLQSVKGMLNGRKRRIVIMEDMVRFVEDRGIVVRRNQNVEEPAELVTDDFMFEKNMTDGGILLSDEVTFYLKAEGNLKHEGQSVQARGSNGVKPFSYGVYKLREMTGADMVFLGGALKLDVLPSLLDGTFSFSVVQGSRLEEEEEVALVATQALLAMDVNPRNLKLLNTLSVGYLKDAISDPDKVMKLLNIDLGNEEGETEEGEEESEDTDVQATDVDMDALLTEDADDEDEELLIKIDMAQPGVQNVLAQAPLAYKDFAVKKKVANLLAKPLEKIKKGGLLVEEAKMRHMAFDIYMVVKAIADLNKDVFDGVEMPTIKYVDSIASGSAVIVDHNGNLREGYFLAVRYPILKKEEVRKILALSEMLSKEATTYYRDAARNGFFQGLVLFNSVDMTTEAMSGADFDGDTCLVIFNEFVVNSFKNQTKMLDFYIDDNGKLKGGCPWADPSEAPDVKEIVKDFLKKTELFVEQEVENGLRTWTLKFKEEDVRDEERAKLVYYVFNRMAAAHITSTAKESSIGSWTNHLMNVEEVLLSMNTEILAVQRKFLALKALNNPANNGEIVRVIRRHDALVKEYGQYEELAKWLVCVVRWAIDEAKHGGAFNKHLEHIIGVFDYESLPTPQELLHYAKNPDVFFPIRLFV